MRQLQGRLTNRKVVKRIINVHFPCVLGRGLEASRGLCKDAWVQMPAQLTYDFTRSKAGASVDQFLRNTTKHTTTAEFQQLREYSVVDVTLLFPIKISSTEDRK